MGKAVNETVWIDRDGVVWKETGDGRLRRDGVSGAVIVDPAHLSARYGPLRKKTIHNGRIARLWRSLTKGKNN